MTASYLYRGSSVGLIHKLVSLDVLLLITASVATIRIPTGNRKASNIVHLLNEVSRLPETGT
jgi:hypothetical protein